LPGRSVAWFFFHDAAQVAPAVQDAKDVRGILAVAVEDDVRLDLTSVLRTSGAISGRGRPASGNRLRKSALSAKRVA
jgi:hypothetical protein